jgi:mannose-6-phosphate isomerase-like protein (cupin superfamily)
MLWFRMYSWVNISSLQLVGNMAKTISLVNSDYVYSNHVKAPPMTPDFDLDAIKDYWTAFLAGRDWRELTASVIAKAVGCGDVYELPTLSRPGEELCIADMRDLPISEPHYHPAGNYEMYVVMDGTANLVVGSHETSVRSGMAVIIPPNHVHYAVPDRYFVTAAINLPGYTDENYIVTTASNPQVGFDLKQFTRLKLQEEKRRAKP